MRVMYVASEATPFIKSGGLADVIGSLPKETAKKDVESIVVIPKYQDMKFVDQIEYVTNFDILIIIIITISFFIKHCNHCCLPII